MKAILPVVTLSTFKSILEITYEEAVSVAFRGVAAGCGVVGEGRGGGLLPEELALEPLDLVGLHLQLHLQRVVLQFESPAKKEGLWHKNPLFIGCEIHPFAWQDHATWEKSFEGLCTV